MQPTKSCTFTQ